VSGRPMFRYIEPIKFVAIADQVILLKSGQVRPSQKKEKRRLMCTCGKLCTDLVIGISKKSSLSPMIPAPQPDRTGSCDRRQAGRPCSALTHWQVGQVLLRSRRTQRGMAPKRTAAPYDAQLMTQCLTRFT
jgi:hypothetical protein